MGTVHRAYLFGDQTSDIGDGLRRLLQAESHTIVSSFFQRCFHALRREVSTLCPSERSTFPRFTSITDLLVKRFEKGSNPALESTLTCIFQLACFIHYHGDLGHAFPSPEDSHIVGVCTGLISSAAVSVSSNIGELLPVAVQAVVLALRLGLCASRVRRLLGPKESVHGNWSVLVSGYSEAEAAKLIENFTLYHKVPPSSKPYISAVGSNNVTITAPPLILDKFLEDGTLRRAPTKIGIYAPFHAPHLYSTQDIEEVLGEELEEAPFCRRPLTPVLSSNTGLPLEAQTYRDLLAAALGEILLTQLRWDKVLATSSSILKAKGVGKCELFPFGTTATQSLVAALTGPNAGDLQVMVKDCMSPNTRDSATDPTKTAKGSDIAIIGMSGRFPESDSLNSFWDLLYKGLDVHREVPESRWSLDAHVDLTGKRKNTSKVPYGCWVNNPGLFDARFFNMSPREALQADPAQRLALLTAYEALEMAGVVPDSTLSTQRDRVGVFYGMTSDDYREVNSSQDVDTYFIPGGNRAFTPGRINYYFKFSGPSINVDTACSSSLGAIHMACNCIRNNDCDTAIAGGVNILTNPDNHTGLDRGHFLSRTGNCNTFDDGADGYCRADGVGTVILKRLEEAQADNDPILGVIKGIYTNHSAEAASITRPHASSQSFIFKKLLNETKTDPKSVSYIEMHGTGTQAGDAVEMESVLDSFASDYKRPPASLFLGSAKANIGHGESASGVASLIKVLLMMRNNMIPPHCGIKGRINHNFPTDLAQRGIQIAQQPTTWARGEGKRTTFVNNFSAAGGNTALLLEDAEVDNLTRHDPRPVHLVALSAKSQNGLKANVEALIEYLDEQAAGCSDSDQSHLLGSLAYTTTARRMHHPFRVTATGSSIQEIRDSMQKSSVAEAFASVPPNPPNVGFAFTGQGSQYVGMGRHLYEDCTQFRRQLHHYNCIVQNQGFPSVIPLIRGSGSSIDEFGPMVIQLGTLCLQMALVDYWKSLGVKPTFVIGHSLGDFAALNAAGILSASDAIHLCGRRCQLLLEHCEIGTHSMLAIKAPLSQVRPLLGSGEIDVACLNGPMETVISGLRTSVSEVAQKCSMEGVKCTELKVPYAFHSAQVSPILGSLKDAAKAVSFQKPAIPFVSCLLGEVVTELNAGLLDADYMVRQCRETVNFVAGLDAARRAGLSNGETIWTEIGSHPICTALIKSAVGSQVTTVASLRRDENAWKTLTHSLSALHCSGVPLGWMQFHQDFKSSHRVLPLPSYKWELKEYWIPYRNNFCVAKGSPAGANEVAQPSSLSASAQQIVEDRGSGDTATVVIQNDIAHPELNRVIQGHKVNGAALCPSSLYADIAQTLCNHLVRKYKPELQDCGLDVCDMTIAKPLIAGSGQQFFRVSADCTWANRCAAIQVYSVTLEGKRTIDHAQCQVKFFDRDLVGSEFRRNSYLIRRSIDGLEKKAESGRAHRMQRRMVYKLFSSLVDYDNDFRSMKEVILDSDEYEATALVKFQGPQGDFYRSPYWIDSLGHLSGFVMNANDATDSESQVFVNHGWEFMRCLKDFSPDATYRTYVKMQPLKGSIWAGDVYIFDGDEIVGISGGIRFQALERKILNTVLPPRNLQTRSQPAKQQSQPITVPKPQSKNEPIRGPPSGVKEALGILASEVGSPESELTDDVAFADYGVDSLLSLTVTGRYREELNLDLDSSVFADCPTVGEFKEHLARMNSLGSRSDSTDASMSTLTLNTSASVSSMSSVSSPPNEPAQPKGSGTLIGIHRIIAEEVGMEAGGIPETQNLGDLGVDSLLALTALGRIREELELDLSDQFFMEHQTLQDISAALNLDSKPTSESLSSATPSSTSSQAGSQPSTTTKHPAATSILLQGSPSSARKNLFLFPDGSGSATSYASLPGVSSDTCVYGLNCPYMKQPENLNCSLDELSTPYINEIRRRQPHGPYNLGGWSAGGICAYDAARRLILEEGEAVDRLILIDSPFPIGLEKLPHRLYDFFNSIGLFGEGKAAPPRWLLPHFLAFIDSLDAYRAAPLPYDNADWLHKMPRTHLVWAKEGVCGKPGDPRPAPAADGSEDPREMRWLLNDRTDLGPNKWDTLVGPDNVAHIQTIEGANHFTMTTGPKARELSVFLACALAR